MAVMQKDVNATYFKGERSYKHKSKNTTQEVSVQGDADAQDAALWDTEISGSLDVLYALADEALADHEAGRTTRISS